MYILLIIIHIIVCLILIATILLQAGRGGGLAEAFGGAESTQSVLGTQAPLVLKRATEVSAILFLITSLVLGMVTARRGRSLLDRIRIPAMPTAAEKQTAVPSQPEKLPPEGNVPQAK